MTSLIWGKIYIITTYAKKTDSQAVLEEKVKKNISRNCLKVVMLPTEWTGLQVQCTDLYGQGMHNISNALRTAYDFDYINMHSL